MSSRMAIFSDVHGNVDALRQGMLLANRYECDEFVFLGDAIGYLPRIDALELILNIRNIHFVRGNHEEYLLDNSKYDAEKEDAYRLARIRRDISDDLIRSISAWPRSIEMSRNNKTAKFVHGSLDDPTHGYVYPDAKLNECSFDFVFMGNTHRPFVKQAGRTTYVNVGSIGLPRDDGRMGALGVWDFKTSQVSILRFTLDAKALSAIRAAHVSVQKLLDRKLAREMLVGEVFEND